MSQLPAASSARGSLVSGIGSASTYALVRAFLRSKSARTRASYAEDLEVFRRFIGLPNLDRAIHRFLNRGQGGANSLALSFRDSLVERGFAPATINRRIAALRSLVLLGRMLGEIPFSLEVPGLRVETYRDTRGPGVEGVRAILRMLDGRHDAKALRDRAIIRMLFDLGLRREEVCSLSLEHVDFLDHVLWVHGKGRSGRVRVALPEPTEQALKAWLELRPAGEGPLFTNFDRAGKGARLTGHSVYRIVRGLGRQAGLPRPVRPHGLRHAAITAALDATSGDVRAVQRFSRHAKLETVSLYDDNRRDLAGHVARLVAQELQSSPS